MSLDKALERAHEIRTKKVNDTVVMIKLETSRRIYSVLTDMIDRGTSNSVYETFIVTKCPFINPQIEYIS